MPSVKLTLSDMTAEGTRKGSEKAHTRVHAWVFQGAGNVLGRWMTGDNHQEVVLRKVLRLELGP